MINLKLYTLALLATLLTLNSYGQDTTQSKNQVEAPGSVEQEPQFPGSIARFISDNIHYPEIARTVGITGKVFVQFVVDTTGMVVDVKASNYLGGGCSAEAVRVISMSPRWRPGIQKGKPVRVMYSLPISFSFDGSDKMAFKDLFKSDYGFIFYINGTIYPIYLAQPMLGNTYDGKIIKDVTLYTNPDHNIPGKKAVYLVTCKTMTNVLPPPTNEVNIGNNTGGENDIYAAVEVEPRFNGDFSSFLGTNIRYPAAEKLIGINGKVFVQYVVEKDGSLSGIKILRARTKGLGDEAARVIAMSPKWQPGMHNSKAVRVMYTVPISFSTSGSNQKTKIKDLQKSNYGFVFFINDQVYSLDDAKAKLGDEFDPATVENIELYDNPQFARTDKKAIYLVTMRTN